MARNPRAPKVINLSSLIITHWHGDHYGGLAELAKRMDGKTDEDMRCNTAVRVLQNIKSAFKGHEG